MLPTHKIHFYFYTDTLKSKPPFDFCLYCFLLVVFCLAIFILNTRASREVGPQSQVVRQMDKSLLLTSLPSPSSSASHTNFKPQFNLSSQPLSFNYSSSSAFIPQFLYKSNNSLPKNSRATVSLRLSVRSSAFVLEEEALVKTNDSSSKICAREMLPKIDKSGRFCSPRAARELALSIVCAACLEGSDPVRLFEKRMNARRELGYDFHKEKLLEYNHMNFGGPPVTVESIEEANELLQENEKESAICNTPVIFSIKNGCNF